MARNMYGATSADFTLTAGGRVVAGATLTVWSARTGGTQVTDLLDVNSVACTTVTSGADGSVVFYGPNNEKSTLWLDSGQGSRIAVRPVDITGETGATPALTIGTVTTGTAAATLTGTDEDPVLSLVLPSAGANGVDTAAIQAKAVTAAKIADDTITATQIAANAVGSSELADNAVDAGAIAAGAVTNSHISATAAIDGSKIAGLGNLLTANQASGTDTLGNTTGFTASVHSIARSTAQAWQGSGSLEVTSGGTDGRAQLEVLFTAGSMSPLMTISAYARAGTGTVGPSINVVWQDAGNNFISEVYTVPVATLTTTWRLLQYVVTPPATAAKAVIRFRWNIAHGNALPSGETVFLDTLSVHKGSGGNWAMPGTPIVGLLGGAYKGALTADATLTGADSVVTADTTSGAVTLTLPAANAMTGRSLRIIKTAGANTLTVQRAGSDTIIPSSGTRTSVAFPSGATFGEMELVSDGTNWYALGGQASDETVGSRLWKWEQAKAATSTTAATGWQLVYADTGLRNVSANLLNSYTGGAYLRRSGITVHLILNSVTGATAADVYTLPTGFRTGSSESRFIIQRTNSGSAYAARASMADGSGTTVSTSALAGTPARASGDTWNASVSWPTTDSWPTSNPGSPA